MTSKYTVMCFSPPSKLELESGHKLRVEGWQRKNKIFAKSITNVTKTGPKCNCGSPTRDLAGREIALLEGIASNIQYFSDLGVQFELQTKE